MIYTSSLSVKHHEHFRLELDASSQYLMPKFELGVLRSSATSIGLRETVTTDDALDVVQMSQRVIMGRG